MSQTTARDESFSWKQSRWFWSTAVHSMPRGNELPLNRQGKKSCIRRFPMTPIYTEQPNESLQGAHEREKECLIIYDIYVLVVIRVKEA